MTLFLRYEASTSFLPSLFLFGVHLPTFSRALRILRFYLFKLDTTIIGLPDLSAMFPVYGELVSVSALPSIYAHPDIPFPLVQALSGARTRPNNIVFVCKRDVPFYVLWWQKTRFACYCRHSDILPFNSALGRFGGLAVLGKLKPADFLVPVCATTIDILLRQIILEP